ncbi:hypothetical protein [Flavobacterium sp.]|uniref:hypothetical protein n=1 Tax=Flavobacterium sp. TaxID=239 RepID=UPI00120F83DA|nr:hypothetical protein [Flavobacterium sp.]RZJ69788.1 MAG: hypothetical protein EOO49_16130 [Flavobacterium sp.]
MHPKLIKIELSSVKTPDDQPFLHPTENFIGQTDHKLFDRKKYEEKSLIWSLMKGAKARESTIDWQYQSSRSQLENGISATEIEHLLNTEHVFGFDYEPSQNDYLSFYFVYRFREFKAKPRPALGDRVSFLFSDGKWVANKGFDHIHLDFEMFRKGKAGFWLDGRPD